MVYFQCMIFLPLSKHEEAVQLDFRESLKSIPPESDKVILSHIVERTNKNYSPGKNSFSSHK